MSCQVNGTIADILIYILLFLGEVVAFLRYFQPGSGDCSLLGRLTSLDPGVLGWVETKGAVAEVWGGRLYMVTPAQVRLG